MISNCVIQLEQMQLSDLRISKPGRAEARKERERTIQEPKGQRPGTKEPCLGDSQQLAKRE